MIFFFFFKQKTAYEMRISDWSSDVCSSDLTQAVLAAGLVVPGDGFVIAVEGVVHARLQRPVRIEGVRHTQVEGRVAAQAHRVGRVVEAVAGALEAGAEGEQIGSAACRERGCQYV